MNFLTELLRLAGSNSMSLKIFFSLLYLFFLFVFIRAYFRTARHTCSMNKKEHILVNLGQFVDETPPKKRASFWCVKVP